MGQWQFSLHSFGREGKTTDSSESRGHPEKLSQSISVDVLEWYYSRATVRQQKWHERVAILPGQKPDRFKRGPYESEKSNQPVLEARPHLGWHRGHCHFLAQHRIR
jgi:hypothetical protein